MILANGVIRTMDAAVPTAPTLTIAGEHIAALGGRPAAATAARVDLGGRCVLPGYSDANVHFAHWALAMLDPPRGRALDEAVRLVATDTASADARCWLCGRGLRSDWRPEVEPTRHDLDAVTADIPVALPNWHPRNARRCLSAWSGTPTPQVVLGVARSGAEGI